MVQKYLDIAKQGKNNWRRYCLGILLIYVVLIIGAILSKILKFFRFKSLPVEQNWLYEMYETGILYAAFCLGIFLAVRCLHQRRFLTLISADGSIKFRRLLLGSGVWLVLDIIYLGIGMLQSPQDYSFTFEPAKWFQLLPLVLVITPIQTTAEELFFRGYLLQAVGRNTRQPLVPALITSALFAALHFANPEMDRGAVWVALDYFAFGMFMAILTLKDNRLELALVVHAATNIFIFLFANSKDSAFPTPAIWTVKPGDPRWDLVFNLVEMAVFYYIFFGRWRKLSTVRQNTDE